MIALLQRVSEASVAVKDGEAFRETGRIGKGLMVLIGVERGDTTQQAERLLERLLTYRVFADAEGRMNLNLQQVNGELMLVSQFTLVAETGKGTRPGFSRGAAPALGRSLFEALVDNARERLGRCASGTFGAEMQVQLINDGPVTFQLRVPPLDA